MRSNEFYTRRARQFVALLLCISTPSVSFARVGGAGGHGGGGGGGGYSGGGGFVGGGGSPVLLLIIIVLIILYQVYKKSQANNGGGGAGVADAPPSVVPFPAGLDPQKVGGSFMAIQNAWQRKDLKEVRKWLSDGMYQRLSTQFMMMNTLGQRNVLQNIQIYRITAADTQTDNNYCTAEIAISFSMDDSFISDKYPQFNESYQGDTDMEYWTFIKRVDSTSEKNLYDNNNCPNCGAPFEVKMGEISRCSNCNTLTNSAAYDWVLSEITQKADYSGGAGLGTDLSLKALMKDDPFFAVQRMEDIASNVFMQIMEAITDSNKNRLSRFADPHAIEIVTQLKQRSGSFVFDRLYLNFATLTRYAVEGELVNLYFDLKATYRRVAVGDKLYMLDSDFVTTPFKLTLSRSKDVLRKANAVETVYSYECSSCGAPYTDTTEDHCSYCGAPVVDVKRNWVMTGFSAG